MISIVSTVYDEMDALPDLLVQLHGLSGQAEIVIVDGMSEDGTYELLCELRDMGERWFTLARAPRCRGEALNEGARLASGDTLLFLHADCVLPEDALAQVEDVLRRSRAGCFGVRFSGSGPFMRWNGFASNARVRLFGIMFGDQGMFMERALFSEAGGFPEIPLMEDYELSRKLRSLGVRPILARGRVAASSRRYGHGTRSQLGTALRMLLLRARYRCGEAVEALAADYGKAR